MRCLSCDRLMTESEDARKFERSGERVSLCNRCVVHVPLPMVGGDDVNSIDIEDDELFAEDNGDEDDDGAGHED